MLNYEVTGFTKPENDTLLIKIRVVDGNEKRGFLLELSDEWVRENLHQVVEGMEYPRVRPIVKPRGSMVPHF